MSLSTTLGPGISNPSEEAHLGAGPTPVTSADLLNVHWVRTWQNLLQSWESGSFSVFLSECHPSASSLPAWAGRSWVGTEITTLIVQAPRTRPSWTVLSTFGAVEPQPYDPATALADLVAHVRQSVFAVQVRSSPDPAQIVSQIRHCADLTAGEIAALMGVSRRSLYHWLSSGRMSSENRERLSEIADALRPLGREWRPVRLKSWLRKNRSEPVRLLRAGNFAAFRRLADESLTEASVPVRSARRLIASEPEPPEYAVRPLRPEQRRAFFDALLEPRPKVTREPSVPRELADSLPSEDE
jgi:transcriptional regulator with XRE-family HTH domain